MNPLVSFIIPMCYDYPSVLGSLIRQTYQNYEVILVHDGKTTEDRLAIDMKSTRKNIERLKFRSIEGPNKDWGHKARAEGLNHVSKDSELVIFSSSDNYYMPIFLEEITKPFDNQKVNVSYCDMVHNCIHYDPKNYGTIKCELRIGGIDCGNFVTRTKCAHQVGWVNRNYEADWMYIREVLRLYANSKESVVKINKVLYVHN
jgi:glycosyltransferase involved in cell wall biosynthesis